MTAIYPAPSFTAFGRAPSTMALAELDVGDLFRAVVPRWPYLFATLALTLSLAGAYVLFTPPRYAATMSLLVDTREHSPVGSGAAAIAQSPDAASVENEMRLLQSGTVLRRVVDEEKLGSDPDFNGPPGGIISRIKASLGGAAKPAETTDARIVSALAGMISVKHADKSNVIDVEVRAERPEKALSLAQALAKAYFEEHADLDRRMANDESKWLDDRIAGLRTRLEQAEARVQAYRKANDIVVSAGLTPLEQQLKEASAALVTARGKRTEAEARYQQSLAATRGGATDGLRSPLLEKLQTESAALTRDAALAQSTLGPRHPTYVLIQSQIAAQRGLIDREINNIKNEQLHDLDAARDVERAAEANIAKLKDSIILGGDKLLGLAQLEQQASTLRESYEKGLEARQTTRRVIVSAPHPVLINEPVTQEGRVSPRTLPALLIAVAAAINLWIVVALLMEYRARRSRAGGVPVGTTRGLAGERIGSGDVPRDAELSSSTSGATFSLPEFEPEKQAKGALPSDSDGNALERAVQVMGLKDHPYRNSVADLHRYLREPARFAGSTAVVAVAGRKANDGVSTLALSLALFACDRGEEVLVLDCDRHHPMLSQLLPYLPSRGAIGRDGIEVFAGPQNLNSGGKILLGRITDNHPLPDRRSLEGRFNLIVLDFGAMKQRSEQLDKEIDLEIMLKRSGVLGQRLALLSRFSMQAEVA